MKTKTDRNNQKSAKAQLLEQKYREIIGMMPVTTTEYRENLRQSPAGTIVPSVVVYGAYEDPI